MEILQQVTLINNIFVKISTNHIYGVINTRISDRYSIFVSDPIFSKDIREGIN